MTKIEWADWPDNLPLDEQVQRLGNWIMANWPGEPSRSAGAVEMANYLLAKMLPLAGVRNPAAVGEVVDLVQREHSHCVGCSICEALANLDKAPE